jgi:hypothetical protein
MFLNCYSYERVKKFQFLTLILYHKYTKNIPKKTNKNAKKPYKTGFF